ncbi:MAG TPA: carboxypeptidase-like regulatory domain-containing protein [Vicinamibacterales bacterium]|nr:carboxypeptidase-like regulatory domain-containing protein [Vicinamibacterales bacterium]
MPVHRLVLTALLLALTRASTAQPQTQAAPPRTATLRGHVFAADNGQPLRNAQVHLMRIAEVRQESTAATDANGAYELTGLRAGRYTLSVSKGSFVIVAYGQQRPTDPPKPIEIAERQLVERIDVSLPRGGVITGRIVDDLGEPIPGVSVSAQRAISTQPRTLMHAGRIETTNDLGEFRLFGLDAGEYFVVATWPIRAAANPAASPRDRVAYAPTYFPGTTNIAEAQPVSIVAGETATDVSMSLTTIRAARVTGTVTGADGKPMTPAMISVSQNGGLETRATTQVRADGTFTIAGLPPGDYALRAQRSGDTDFAEQATTTISVNGDDVADVQLFAAKAAVISGRLIVDAVAGGRLPRTMLVSIFPMGITGVGPPSRPARIADDGTFELRSAPGRVRLFLGSVAGSADEWRIQAVRSNGADVTNTGIDLKAGDHLSDIELAVTNKVASVSGIVTDSRGDVPKDYTAVLFSQDREKWLIINPFQQIARPDQNGRFKISNLPPGDYYAVAVDRLEPGRSLSDFFERMRDKAAKVSLAEGEARTIALKLTSGS